ncbi:MAG TPA: peptidylprolyl isomerase [Arenibaculum sp.]|nr:peptidylprolyl isomerase [Arenibaculum sp.]
MHVFPIPRTVRIFSAALTLAVMVGTGAADAQFTVPQRGGDSGSPQSGSLPGPSQPDPSQSAPVQMVERIAAVVNDDIVSLSDLEARIRLAILSSGLPDTPETRQRLHPQVLRLLIDERLQLQEAGRANISVSDEEIAEGLANIARQNGMEPEAMEAMLAARGVPVSTLRSQLRANIAWSKLVQRRIRPTIEIGEDEVDRVLDRIQANAGKPEYLVGEIFLAVDSPDQDEDVRRLAERLVEQIRQGANFPAVARQFSQSAGAASGGDLGWVQSGQLPEELDRQLTQMQPGQLSLPVRSVSGYHILLVRDQRAVMAGDPAAVRVGLKQVFVPADPGADEATMKARIEALRAELGSCEAMDERAQALADGVSGDLGAVRLGDLPPPVARMVSSLPVGEPSPPMFNDTGALVLMVCSREAPETSAPAREQIMQALGGERMDMLQRRLLRDLRNAAFVDIRV